jgi:hypothetical protein
MRKDNNYYYGAFERNIKICLCMRCSVRAMREQITYKHLNMTMVKFEFTLPALVQKLNIST